MEVLDIARIAAAAHKRGVFTVVDNTFATPVDQSPLVPGADIVVHSTTKYLGGHSTLTGGAVIGPKPRSPTSCACPRLHPAQVASRAS